METPHIPHSRIEQRKVDKKIKQDANLSFDSKLAVLITKGVGSMWCAYLFTALALISLPQAINDGLASTVNWVAQTFLQLVLLSVILVGQKIAARTQDEQAEQTYKDAEALLEMQDEVHRLIKINNALTEEIRSIVKDTKNTLDNKK